MNISVAGNLGSGKSTVCALLKDKGYNIVSAGEIFRQIAERMKISINEMNRMAEEDEEYDRMVDMSIRQKGSLAENTIFDSRMAWYFVPFSFKVFLYLDVNIAAERVFYGEKRVAEDYVSIEDARDALVIRANQEKERYEKLYQVNIYDMANYDLVIDTADKTLDQIVNMIMEGLEAYKCENKKHRLYYWYVDNELRLHGNITHHPDFFDGEEVTSIPLAQGIVDEENGEIVFCTESSKYYCKLAYWDIEKQKKQKQIKKLVADYKKLFKVSEILKTEIQGRSVIEPGNVLVRFSNFDPAMFNSLHCVPNEGDKPVGYRSDAHTGMYKDSYIINTSDYSIDIRYFCGWGIEKFYRMETAGMPLWFENVGDRTIIIGMGEGEEIILRSGERRLVDKTKYLS